MVITEQWLKAHRTANGGYTRAQLAILGIQWPPPKGWMRFMAGRVITDYQRDAFERMKRQSAMDYLQSFGE